MRTLALFGFWLRHVALLAVFAGAALSIGSRLLRRLSLASRIERLALSTIFGLGGLGTVFFLLGVLRLFDAPEVLAALIASYAIAWREWREVARSLRQPTLRPDPARSAFVLLFAAAAMALSVVALYPPLDADSTMYHLPVARAFAASHALPALPALRYPVFPQLHEVLAAAALLVADDLLAQLLNVLWCLLVVGALFAWSRRVGGGALGFGSAVLWLGSPIVLALSHTTHVELAVAAFATGALLATHSAIETGDRYGFVAAGALAGWAAATKYTGLYFVAVLGVVALLGSRRGSRVRAASVFALGALAATVPWYLRNALLSGNPVWPFLANLFGYRFWTAKDVASCVWTLRQEGGPYTVPAFLALPWTLSWGQPAPFWLSPALFMFLPLGAVVALGDRRLRWVLAVTLGYLVFWFATTHQVRFLLPILPAIALLDAAAVARLFRFRGSEASPAVRAVGILLAAAILLPGGRQLATALQSRGLVPLQSESRDAFLARRLPSYECYRRLNREHGSTYTIYAMYDEPMKYYCQGTHLGDWFGFGRYADMDLSTGERLFASLQHFGAGYFLVNEAFYPVRLPEDAFFREHFVPIFEGNRVRAFRVR